MGAINNYANSSMALASNLAFISNIRGEIYKKKLEIIKTPMVREIVSATFLGGFLPKSILINREFICAQVYDAKSNTYHPNGERIYTPDVTFDYIFAAAVLSIFQDLYPDVYEMNKISADDLVEKINLGTWYVALTMKDEFLFKRMNPAFDIFNIANIPIEQLPLTLEDKYTKNASGMAMISLIVGIVSFVGALVPFGFIWHMLTCIAATVGIVTGAIELFSSRKEKKKKILATIGVLLSVASWIIPIFFAIIFIAGGLCFM